MKTLILTASMFGTDMNPTSHAFGLTCGQMRPTMHDCKECGLNPQFGRRAQGPVRYLNGFQRAPLAWCACKRTRVTCAKMTHNSGWYNSKGEKLGWGDLCACDMRRIAEEMPMEETVYILPEYKSRWQIPEGTDEQAPGVAYCMQHCVYVIKNLGVGVGTVFAVRDHAPNLITAEVGVLTYNYITRGDVSKKTTSA